MSKQQIAENHVSLRSYIAGFVLSLVLTVSAYLVAARSLYGKRSMIIAIAVLAVTQFIVQMLFFLHLGTESKPRWKLLTLFFMLGVVGIIVLGSLWIMYHLDYNMMSQQDMQHYMDSQDSL